MKTKKITIILLIVLALFITLGPLFIFRGADFEGSDGAGTDMIYEVTDDGYEAWFTPVLETILDGELPGEMESLFFCLQTGIGVGILAYCFGFLVARKKYDGDDKEKKVAAQES
jgi:ABC-type cobalt transport system, periplasmic component